MSGHGSEFQQWVNVSGNPGNIQWNGDRIKPRLRQYILNGEPCEYNQNIRQALIKFTGGKRIKYTGITVLIIVTFYYFFKEFIDEHTRSAMEIVSFSVIPLAILTVIITVFILKVYSGSIALRLADRGEAKCFKYKLHRMLRYESDPYEKDCFYYADLGDFCVNISENDSPGCTVTGIVVNIRGTEYFYLLV